MRREGCERSGPRRRDGTGNFCAIAANFASCGKGLAEELAAFAEAVHRYVELTKDDTTIHKIVVKSVNGLRDFIQPERKRIPDDIVFDANRLECLLFADPSFEGDEPPGL